MVRSPGPHHRLVGRLRRAHRPAGGRPVNRLLVGRWRTAGWLIGCGALIFALWVNQDQNERLGDVVTRQNMDRLESDHASCERGNEIREGIRNLARDLNADTETLTIVGSRFAAVDCSNIPGG
jgi:hypothetical protein